MKKALLPLLIASALPMSAFADVTVYGKANVSLQNSDESDNSQFELVSNASRIGLKGGEQINDGLKAIYQFEYQTEVDDGANGSNNQTFGQRNIFVGLQGTAGTLIAGKFDTPVKAAQEKVDLFNDLEGDMSFVMVGETRANNIVQYSSPLLGKAVTINVAQVSAEDPAMDDGLSVSATYTSASWYAALATEKDITAQGADITRAVGRYTLNAWQFGLLIQQAKDAASNKTNSWLVSTKYSLNDSWALKAQYGDADLDLADGKRKQLSVGADYSLSKNTTLFGFYTQEKADAGSVNVSDDNWIGVGMELKF